MQSGGVMPLHTLLFWFPRDSLATESRDRLGTVALALPMTGDFQRGHRINRAPQGGASQQAK